MQLNLRKQSAIFVSLSAVGILIVVAVLTSNTVFVSTENNTGLEATTLTENLCGPLSLLEGSSNQPNG